MMISGPWARSNIEKSGIDFVAPIPAIDGEAGKPFVGVAAALLNAASPNKDPPWSFSRTTCSRSTA